MQPQSVTWVYNNLGMIIDSRGNRIATIDSQIENARLVAAAPEMYRALVAIRAIIEGRKRVTESYEHFTKLVEIALNKAEGKNS